MQTVFSVGSILGVSAINFILANASGNWLNWLAGGISVVYGACIVAMWQHMTDDEKHIDRHINSSKLVTNDQCEKTHTSVVEKLEELKKDLIERDKKTEEKMMKELEYSKLLVETLLLRAGVDIENIK